MDPQCNGWVAARQALPEHPRPQNLRSTAQPAE